MARPLRVEYANAIYHVIARGNAYQDIFFDDKDRSIFLDWLKDSIETHNLICHAYCLMNNHYHLLLETPDANLSTAMRDLNGNYSQWSRARHKTVGHLFQGRYKAFVIEKESYLLEVARYIVLNPVRAGITNHPKLWKWSSYCATTNESKNPDWLHIDWILGNFSNERKSAEREYRQFVLDGVGGKDPHDDVSHNLILGTPQFVHWIWEHVTNGSEELAEYPREQRIVGRPTLDLIFKDVTDLEKRNEAIIFARLRCGYLNTEIARHLNLNNSTIGKIVRGTYNSK